MDIFSAWELLRRTLNAHSAIIDAFFVGAVGTRYAGNIATLNTTRSEHIIGQRLVDPEDGDDIPGIPPAVKFLQQIEGRERSVTGNRVAYRFERVGIGTVSAPRALIGLFDRTEDGATAEGAWIEDVDGRSFSIQKAGTFFSRGGLFLFGPTANAVVRGGNAFVEDGGAIVAMGPGVTSDDATGTSFGFARNAGSGVTMGDIYGNDVDVTLLGNLRLSNPSGAPSTARYAAWMTDLEAAKPAALSAVQAGAYAHTVDSRPHWWDKVLDRHFMLEGDVPTALLSVVTKGYLTGFGQPVQVGASSVTFRGGVARSSDDLATITLQRDTAPAFGALGNNNTAAGCERRQLAGTASTTVVSSAVVGVGTAFLTGFGGRALTQYLAAAPTVSSAGTVITGTNTKFLRDVAVNDLIGTVAKGFARVATVNSDTSITLVTPPPVGLVADTILVVETPNLVVTNGVTFAARKINSISSNTALVLDSAAGALLTAQPAYTGIYGAATPQITGAAAAGSLDQAGAIWLYVWAASGGSGTTLFWSTQRTTPYGTVAGYTTSYRRIAAFFWAGDDVNFAGTARYEASSGASRRRCYYYQTITNRVLLNGVAIVLTSVRCDLWAPPTAPTLDLNAQVDNPVAGGLTRRLWLIPRNITEAVTMDNQGTQADAGEDDEIRVLLPCDGAQFIRYRISAAPASLGVNLSVVGYEDETNP